MTEVNGGTYCGFEWRHLFLFYYLGNRSDRIIAHPHKKYCHSHFSLTFVSYCLQRPKVVKHDGSSVVCCCFFCVVRVYKKIFALRWYVHIATQNILVRRGSVGNVGSVGNRVLTVPPPPTAPPSHLSPSSSPPS